MLFENSGTRETALGRWRRREFRFATVPQKESDACNAASTAQIGHHTHCAHACVRASYARVHGTRVHGITRHRRRSHRSARRFNIMIEHDGRSSKTATATATVQTTLNTVTAHTAQRHGTKTPQRRRALTFPIANMGLRAPPSSDQTCCEGAASFVRACVRAFLSSDEFNLAYIHDTPVCVCVPANMMGIMTL